MPTETLSAFGKIANTKVDRRVLLSGAVGAATIPLLAACSTGGGSTTKKTQSFTFGSYASDPVPKKGYGYFISGFEKKTGDKVAINTVSHNDFQNNINTYLQGSPDDAFTWFAGYRMRYYAAKGLVANVDDVWDKIGGSFSAGLKAASTADDGHQYFVPNYNYPWGFFYRKSLWADKGYEVPTKFDDLITLAKKMQGDGIIPIGFADKDAWPACGTFDYINMRLNGYQFHLDLCAHKESWNQPKVQKIFDTWKEMLPFQDPSALGATWQDAAGALAAKKTGMYLLGSFVTQQFTDPTVLADIDFFEFPEIAVEGQTAVEAPIDGLMLSKRGGQVQGAHDLLAYMGTPAGQEEYYRSDKSNLMTVKGADTSSYSAFSKKLAGVIANAGKISQFFDRDSLPAMASNALEPAMQGFLKDGTIDIANLESQAKTLYAAQ
jgi:multiple sugar transport system substrate-binding protein